MMILKLLPKQNSKGFSLIELLIVVAIMMLFSGIYIAYYNDFTVKQKLDSETKKLVDVLELAKKKTNVGDSSQCGGANITPMVDNYSVEVTSSTQYSLVPDCLTGTPTPIAYPTLSSPITFSSSPLTVEFRNLNVGASITGASCIQLENLNDPSKCTYINVQSSGLVELKSCSVCPCSCP